MLLTTSKHVTPWDSHYVLVTGCWHLQFEDTHTSCHHSAKINEVYDLPSCFYITIKVVKLKPAVNIFHSSSWNTFVGLDKCNEYLLPQETVSKGQFLKRICKETKPINLNNSLFIRKINIENKLILCGLLFNKSTSSGLMYVHMYTCS